VRVSIDTNAYTGLMAGDSSILEILKSARRIAVSSIVVGELLYGFRHGSRYSENRRQLDMFLSENFVDFLPVTLATCDRYAMVATSLRTKGIPIPQNDIWIAAHALESGTDLLSFDKHFANVNGLVFTLLPS
jgi:tRNA(fMet)-specific endonuclease VapC